MGLPENPTALNIGPDNGGSRLEIGLTDRNLADADIFAHTA